CEILYVTDLIIKEIRDVKSKSRLNALPCKWVTRNPLKSTIQRVRAFLTEICEIKALSEADISLIALTIDLQESFGDSKSIKWETKDIEIKGKCQDQDLPGFCNDCCVDEWLTPSKLEDLAENNNNEALNTFVACASNDNAIQNSCLILGLKIVCSRGYFVNIITKYVLLCTFCLRISDDNTRNFCFFCGNKSLQKTCYSINEKGERELERNPSKRPGRTADNSWMSSLNSMIKNGGSRGTEQQLRSFEHRKKLNRHYKVSKIVDSDGFPLQPFSVRDTSSTTFNNRSRITKR
ncbi:hypothetical protein MXB_2620, partial [Myxobolus squamalis]